MLKGRSDWRDVEALAHLDPPANEDLFRTFVNESMPLVTRLAAGESLRELGEWVDFVPLIVNMVDAAEGDVSVMSRVFDHIEWNLPADPRVKRHLLTRLLNMTTPPATNFAATVWVVYGLCETRYDWTDRPEWLKFQDPAEHDAAMDRLLVRIGVTREQLSRSMRG